MMIKTAGQHIAASYSQLVFALMFKALTNKWYHIDLAAL